MRQSTLATSFLSGLGRPRHCFQRSVQDWVRSLPAEEAQRVETWPPRASDRLYDWETSTHEVYHDPECSSFTPPFSTARQRLDYSYHLNPAPSRQALQDSILSRVVQALPNDNTNGKSRPWLVFSAGSMGVGKGYVLTQLHQSGLFPAQEFLKIDPDFIKSELPEFPGYREFSTNPSLAATQVHRESTMMADTLLEHALSRGISTLVDGSLRDVDHYTELLDRIRKEYPQYRVGLIHVVADREIIFQRAKDRAVLTGRDVPRQVLEESMEQVPRSVQQLTPYTDATFTVENNENEPLRLISSDGSNPSWQEFRRTWTDEDTISNTKGNDDPGVCQMSSCWDDSQAHEAARQIWSEAYPNFCPRCSLVCDGQCGLCIHGVHVCACPDCRTKGG
ncbi:Zeta toxin [Seminavis robusta]|uniref:Zeta toxin n=1 Tax=Seminavis robusta TaxID=568900 RepID=A0A9N8E3X6_9STRA|nr:Zeta toxin [Seminavis robusta]|eukprot:Sro499_g155100.1 Zeta toxin (392) ;mRNA; f:37198-38373